MLAIVAAVLFVFAFIFQVADAPHEVWLQPEALLYFGLALLAVYVAGVNWNPFRHS